MDRQIVGGVFGLPEPSMQGNAQPPFLQGNKLLLVNCRSAIKLVIDTLDPQNVWVPSFLCDSILVAIHPSKVRFYSVDQHLKVSTDWLSELRKDDLVILIDYFGFLADSSLIKSIKERGCWVLEDASQALLSSNAGLYANFVVFSPRKFVGVPDGGILRCNTHHDFSGITLQSPPADWWLKSLSSNIHRSEFDVHGGERTWFELFKEAENNVPLGLFAMSELSQMLLSNSFDYPSLMNQRRENYNVLNEYLNGFALFPDLPSDVIPLGFPLSLMNRDHVKQKLFEQNIFPPVHWPIASVVPSEFVGSHTLSSRVLTLVCDQRYNAQDMIKTAEIVLKEAQNG